MIGATIINPNTGQQVQTDSAFYNQVANQGWLTDVETTLGDLVHGRWNPVDPNAAPFPAGGIAPFIEAGAGEAGTIAGKAFQGAFGQLTTETIVALGLLAAVIVLAPTMLQRK